MSTPFSFSTIAPTGSQVVAALRLPPGKQTAAGTNVTGGTVSGTATVPTGATAVYVGLPETPAGSGVYEVRGVVIAGTALPNTTDEPYTVEARVVTGATMTDYTSIATKFGLSTDICYTGDVPKQLLDGLLITSGSNVIWYAAVNVRGETMNAVLTTAGLDNIPTTRPAGIAATFREMFVELFWQRFGKLTLTSTQKKTYAADGTTVLATQAVSNDGTTQTQGQAA